MSSDTTTPPGWYPDSRTADQERWWDGRAWSDHVRPTGTGTAVVSQPGAGAQSAQPPKYVVLQVVLKEKFLGTGSGNLTELEHVINTQASSGYRLHTISTAASGSKGIGGGDRIQATMVFERLA